FRGRATHHDARLKIRESQNEMVFSLGLGFVCCVFVLRHADSSETSINRLVSSWASYTGSSHCFPCLEASFWTSESMASRIAGSGTMLDSYLEPPSFTEESRWPHQGRSRKTCPALSGKQSIPTHSYAATRETAMAAFRQELAAGSGRCPLL